MRIAEVVHGAVVNIGYPQKDLKMGMNKEIRESWLNDMQILRNRNMTLEEIAETLHKDPRQIYRWCVMLKRERRWRIEVPRPPRKEWFGRETRER